MDRKRRYFYFTINLVLNLPRGNVRSRKSRTNEDLRLSKRWRFILWPPCLGLCIGVVRWLTIFRSNMLPPSSLQLQPGCARFETNEFTHFVFSYLALKIWRWSKGREAVTRLPHRLCCLKMNNKKRSKSTRLVDELKKLWTIPVVRSAFMLPGDLYLTRKKSKPYS